MRKTLKILGVVVIGIIILLFLQWFVNTIIFDSQHTTKNTIHLAGKGHQIILDENNPNMKCDENTIVLLRATIDGITNDTSIRTQAICENNDNETIIGETTVTNTHSSTTWTNSTMVKAINGNAKCKVTYISEEEKEYDWRAQCTFPQPFSWMNP